MSLTKTELMKKPSDFRIGAIISDGMWMSFTKWKANASVDDAELNKWVNEKLASGDLLQSETGARSYRFPLESIIKWYKENNLVLGDQLLSFTFPPRIWDGMTETEGFLSAPLREIAVVSFSAPSELAQIIIEKLRGIARVREVEPNRYKAFCLNATYVRKIIDAELKKSDVSIDRKVYSLALAKRRELVDFSEDFKKGIVVFYKAFARSLVKKEMDTIKIFLPEEDDRDSQLSVWVITAIEKFDETAAVPFSGYLNTVLRRWPYDLPQDHLGKELSNFQRTRSKAVKSLRKKYDDKDIFTNEEIASEMGVDFEMFKDLEEKNQMWVKSQSATTLSWDENSDEKMIDEDAAGTRLMSRNGPSNTAGANKISLALIKAALETGEFGDAFTIISQIEETEINMREIQDLSDAFVRSLGSELGIHFGA